MKIHPRRAWDVSAIFVLLIMSLACLPTSLPPQTADPTVYLVAITPSAASQPTAVARPVTDEPAFSPAPTEPAATDEPTFSLAPTDEPATDEPIPPPSEPAIVVDIYVLDFDPLIDGLPLSEYKNWHRREPLIETYFDDVQESSGGTVVHHLAHYATVRTYPEKPGGFVFTSEQYLPCITDPDFAPYCRPIIDYGAVLNTRYDSGYVSACEAIEAKGIDEIWLWGGPWFGYWEFHVVQPHSLCPSVDRQFVVMGFSYERGETEMLHNLGHRAETALQSALGQTLWNRFDGQRDRYAQDYACPPETDVGHPEIDTGDIHCGNVHFPPNAYCHYQYDRDLSVQSDCADWANYPNLTGQKTPINADTWGSDQHGYLKWWLSHLPRQPGMQGDVYNNWWKYIYSAVDP